MFSQVGYFNLVGWSVTSDDHVGLWNQLFHPGTYGECQAGILPFSVYPNCNALHGLILLEHECYVCENQEENVPF